MASSGHDNSVYVVVARDIRDGPKDISVLNLRTVNLQNFSGLTQICILHNFPLHVQANT